MKNTRALDFKYSLLMIAMNMAFAVFGSYGTVYLLAKDFDEGEIGLIIASSSILATMIQPIIAGRADNSKRWTLKEFNLLLLFPTIIALLLLIFYQKNILVIGLFFIVGYTLINCLMPLINSVAMVVVSQGYKLEYGIGRAMGSLGFAVSTSILAVLVENQGIDSVMIFALIASILYGLMIIQFPLNKTNPQQEAQVLEQMEDEGISIVSSEIEPDPKFFRKYPDYMVVLLGVMMFFIFHSMVNTYMFQIIRNVGGDQTMMSFAFSLGAMVEIPIMLSYSWYKHKFSTRSLMMCSAVFFVIKAVITLFAPNIQGIYLAQITQMLAFGLYATVSIHYAYETVSQQDLVKGQSYLITAQTIGAIIGNLGGGLLLKHYSVGVLLVVCLVVCLIGLISFGFGLRVFSNDKIEKLDKRHI